MSTCCDPTHYLGLEIDLALNGDGLITWPVEILLTVIKKKILSHLRNTCVYL